MSCLCPTHCHTGASACGIREESLDCGGLEEVFAHVEVHSLNLAQSDWQRTELWGPGIPGPHICSISAAHCDPADCLFREQTLASGAEPFESREPRTGPVTFTSQRIDGPRSYLI